MFGEVYFDDLEVFRLFRKFSLKRQTFIQNSIYN